MVTVMSAWEVQDAPISRDAVKIRAACATRPGKAGRSVNRAIQKNAPWLTASAPPGPGSRAPRPLIPLSHRAIRPAEVLKAKIPGKKSEKVHELSRARPTATRDTAHQASRLCLLSDSAECTVISAHELTSYSRPKLSGGGWSRRPPSTTAATTCAKRRARVSRRAP